MQYYDEASRLFEAERLQLRNRLRDWSLNQEEYVKLMVSVMREYNRILTSVVWTKKN